MRVTVTVMTTPSPPSGSATERVWRGELGLSVLTFDLVGREVYLWGGKQSSETAEGLQMDAKMASAAVGATPPGH